MRQNPPFNMDYITATFLLEKISNKTQIINDPFAVRNMPEKLYSINFFIFISKLFNFVNTSGKNCWRH